MSFYNDLLAAGLPVELLPDGSFTFTRSISDDEAEKYYNILDPQRPIRLAEAIADRKQLKDEYQTTITQLQNIETATSPTNAQIITAIKFLARTIRLLLKLIARTI